MKINKSELQKIRDYEKRHGIYYATTTGKLYNGLLLAGFLVWIYMMLMALFYISGNLIIASENNIPLSNPFITILCAFSVTLVSPVFFAFKQKAVAFLINLTTLPILAMAFVKQTLTSGNSISSKYGVSEFDYGLFGLRKIFYWRHGIPMFIVLVICIWLLVITARERKIIRNEFEKINNDEYRSQIISKNE